MTMFSSLYLSWPLLRFAGIIAGLTLLLLFHDVWRTFSRKKEGSSHYSSSSAPPPLAHLMVFSLLVYAGFYDLGNYWTWWSIAFCIDLLFFIFLALLHANGLIEKSYRDFSTANEILSSFILLCVLMTISFIVYFVFVVLPGLLFEQYLSAAFSAIRSFAEGYWPFIFYGMATLQFLFFRKNAKAFASAVLLLMTVVLVPLFLPAFWPSLIVGVFCFFMLYLVRERYIIQSPGEGEATSITIRFIFLLGVSILLSLI